MNQKGLSVVEAMVALVVLAIALAAIIPSMTSYTKVSRDSETRGGAVAAAQQVFDTLRNMDFSDWPVSGTVQTVNSGTKNFPVKMSWCAKGTANCLTTDTARHIKIEVSDNEKIVYQVETVYTDFD